MSVKRLKTCIIGAGHIARLHGNAIANIADAQLVGVADKDVQRAKAVAAEFNVDNYYQGPRQMLNEQRPHVVHILTPPHDHAAMSIIAMRHGCHVLVEKPMALSRADTENMIAVATKKKVCLCVDHNLLFETTFTRCRELFLKGLIGDLVSVEVHFVVNARRYSAILEEGAEYSHWSYTLNGGPLQDLMPHPAALALEFLSDLEDVRSITVDRGPLPVGWQDEVRILIRSGNLTGYISLSLSAKPEATTLTLRGTHGTLRADLFRKIVTLQPVSALPRALARGLSSLQLAYQHFTGACGNVYKFLLGRVDKTDGLAPLVAGFYQAIAMDGEPPVSLTKSLRVVELIERIWPVPVEGRTKADQILRRSKRQNSAPTVLVTGASGFIGTHLIKKLKAQNLSIRALVRPNSIHRGRLFRDELGVEIVEGDLSDPAILNGATRGIEIIYHAGATTNGGWREHEQVTIQGTANLLAAAIANNVERFVHLSTLAVYELLDADGVREIREDAPYQKRAKLMGPYAYAKIQAEKLAFDAYKNSGLGVTIVRPGIVVGPLGRVFFPHLGLRYQDRIFVLMGKGDSVLPLTYVENTVDGILKASIEEIAVGQAYNLIDDGEITAKQYLETFVRVTGSSARIISVPYVLPYSAIGAYELAAFFGVVKKGVTSRAQLRWKQAAVLFDNTKAKTQLGWKPLIPIEEALDRTFRWYSTRYK
jgi:predicted dehydrogenase/nucleoside-diphosphate-sugar epimerase